MAVKSIFGGPPVGDGIDIISVARGNWKNFLATAHCFINNLNNAISSGSAAS